MKRASKLFAVVILCAAWVAGGLGAASAQAQSPTGGAALAAQRAQHLQHGINLSNWFQAAGDPSGLTQQHIESAITDADLTLIQAMGFDHVRLCINPAPLFRRGQADQLPPVYLAYLDAAVEKVLAHGLAVELDIHAGGDFKHALATDDRFVQDFTDFWTGLARHFASTDPDKVFLEILNEPELSDPQLSFQLAQLVPDLDFRQILLATRSESERMRRLAEFFPNYGAKRREIRHVRAVAPTNGHSKPPAGL